MIHSLRLPLEIDLGALRADLAALPAATWRPHFNTGYYDGDWSGVALRANPGAHVPLYSDPTREDFIDTDALRQCAYLPRLLGEFRCPVKAVRFLRLGAGAHIREHRDFGLCFEEGSARVHLPVLTHPDVEFMLDDVPLCLRAGECWYLNLDLKHRLANRSECDRVHLVVDLQVDAWLRAWFERARIAGG